MKKLILIIALTTLNKVIKSQDIIVKNDSSKLQTVVLEIRSDCVKYGLFNYTNGPTIFLNKTDIAYIVFKNGIVERYTNPIAKQVGVEFDKYNLDGSKPHIINEYTVTRKTKDLERLYSHKNYLGFNYMGLLNSTLSFSYMRDFRKDGFILYVPFSFGIGNPNMTNATYNSNYLQNGNKTTYNLKNYEIGLAMLFSPALNNQINFLVGPSLSFSQFDMSTKCTYQVSDLTQQPNQYTSETFKNNFVMFRQQYGGSIGLLARINHRLNMSFILAIGCKKDTYNEKDPYGIDYMNTRTLYAREKNTNVLPYANFAWTMGYRF